MNFSELIDAVADLTVRPDKEGLAAQKINAVLRTISISGTYWPDLVEEVLSDHPDFNPTQNVHTLALPDRFRKPAYIERDLSAINPSTGRLESRMTHGLTYNRVTPKTTKREGREIRNAYYMSGANLLLRQEVAGERVLWGYYAYQPRLVSPSDSNWITEKMPDLIIDWASQFILASLGDRDRTAGVAALAQFQLSVFVDEMIQDSDVSVETGR
jgi:hypothetical protein